MGYISEIFAEHIHPSLVAEVRPMSAFRPRPEEKYVIYHHSIGSTVVDRLLATSLGIILAYHNVTPPEFFAGTDPALAKQMVQGREQLAALRKRTALALPVSPYNAQELLEAQFRNTHVLPLVLDESCYRLSPGNALRDPLGLAGPRLLFVGRLVPNKKQEDLIKLLHFYRRIRPQAHLVLVGDAWLVSYAQWLHEFARDLNLHDSVVFAGHVSQMDLVAHYAYADVYVSMSEHEGFAKPIVESMYMGLPVMAYGSAGVPGTLGGAGVLFHEKEYEALAEMVDMLVHNPDLRRRVISRQRNRAESFLEPQVRHTFERLMAEVW
jgi:glycosyltransferase involved in cell wall biosynthesis